MSRSTPARVDGSPLQGLASMTLAADIPRLGALHCPERTALVFAERGRSMSYRELDRRSDAFVALLHARGIRTGERIAYLGRNNDLYFPVLFGAIRAGVVLVPLNWRLAAPEIAYQLADSESRLLLCDADFVATAQDAMRELPQPPELILVDSDNAPCLQTLLDGPAAPSARAYAEDQVIALLYTSGTTGSPKGVMFSHHGLSIARLCELQMPGIAHLGEGCICLSAMPSFHSGGLAWVLMGLIRKGTVVLTADPSADNMLRLFRDYRIEHTFIVPTVLRAIVDRLAASGEAAPPIRGMFYGAMAIGESLLHEAIATFGCAFGQFFGMTENTGSVTYLDPADHDPARPQLLRSVGKPYPGMSVEIRDADRRVLGRGEHGEIWVRSPTTTPGYWNKPEKTREALHNGWYATGDGGYVDDDGFLYLTDRIKDMIVSGGENIYPAEVEEALRQHPAVLDVAVISIPDRRWGEAVTAVVELRPGQNASVPELDGFARTRIAAYKCPKHFRFIDVLPRTASGKVRRVELRERYTASTND